jgi:hypothetical protein
METPHNLQHAALFGGLFAAGLFLFVNAVALIQLEPLDLRKRSIYVVCSICGFLFGLNVEFGYLIPHDTKIMLLLVLLIPLSIVTRSWRDKDSRGKSDRWW